MTAPLARTDRVTLLREVSEGPLTALFAGERRTRDDVQLVAVKVLRHRRMRDLEQLASLRELGRRLHRIGHRNIVAVTELAVVEGQPALLSPWVDGVDLLDWVEVLREIDAGLPTRAVCEILKSAAAALDAALNRTAWGEREPLGMLHRDVKPSNLMIARDGEVKLLDFSTGISSLGGRDGRSTAVKAGLGRYLSPGRRQGKRGSAASDVYALGLVGVELLGGRWLQRVRDSNPAHDRHLAEVVANLPDLGLRSAADDRTLRSLLLRMVAFDPDARPSAPEVAQTMRTLADRAQGPSLEAFAHDHAQPAFVPPDQEHLAEGAIVEPEELPTLVAPDPDEDLPPTMPSMPPGLLFEDDEDEELDAMLTVPLPRTRWPQVEEHGPTELIGRDVVPTGTFEVMSAETPLPSPRVPLDATVPFVPAAQASLSEPPPGEAPTELGRRIGAAREPDAREVEARAHEARGYALPIMAGAVGIGGLMVALLLGVALGVGVMLLVL